ncbi:transposase family protein [Verminephrobacter eiseniae]|nr:transposase family protein [Verminephrobacter eiseniae]MCW5305165.1 transposase family protein [Verminephrobacter eiseniae]MCW8181239.1 transposase family protein [Verminephrobacter eiseniae]MCW8192776.1 transposase family protein [Verminephrobacter eiseniae]
MDRGRLLPECGQRHRMLLRPRAGASKFVYIQRLTISRCKSDSGIVPTLGFQEQKMAEKDTIEELIEQLRQLKDPQVAGRTDHNLLDILVLALCAVMSGAQGWDDIEDWGRAREGWLRRYLKLRNGIPGHDTIRRVSLRWPVSTPAA